MTAADVDALVAVLAPFAPDPGAEAEAVAPGTGWGELAREQDYLRHPVFSSFASETAMMRSGMSGS